VVGGLYGNEAALDAIRDMRAREPDAVMVFNGDFNWFNIDDAGFRAINERALRHDAVLGNVEAELGADADDAGCGCAYPDDVDQGTVDRSNQIHAALKRTAARHPDLLARLAELPMYARYRVGNARVGVVHGDADSLAGWRFDAGALDDPRHADWRARAFARADVDVFASTHTCLPAMRSFHHGATRVIANNGAAGMPNASGARFGILTRVATTPSPHPRLYGQVVRGTHVDALAIDYDDASWQKIFLANWPAGSAAWRSYFTRIANGPLFELPRRAA